MCGWAVDDDDDDDDDYHETIIHIYTFLKSLNMNSLIV